VQSSRRARACTSTRSFPHTRGRPHFHAEISTRSEARFWNGASIPTTPAASKRYSRKTIDLARRRGKVSGWLLPHISTADTARDLDHLRRLVGDRKLTHVGLSYGTLLGQTYANMFPDRAIVASAARGRRQYASRSGLAAPRTRKAELLRHSKGARRACAHRSARAASM
jgi:pimeloyl-ACP methyl ester carboxylesterase